jgi:hypothetical protein
MAENAKAVTDLPKMSERTVEPKTEPRVEPKVEQPANASQQLVVPLNDFGGG